MRRLIEMMLDVILLSLAGVFRLSSANVPGPSAEVSFVLTDF